MRYLVAPVALLVGAGTMCAADADRPNVIIFLSDDVGWAEYGFQGNKDIPTPNIDSIAASGVRFTQGYVSGPYCSPTRAGLMTGRYQMRFGHEFNTVARESGLSLKEKTIADRLKALGYATAAVGKWHLGQKPPFRPWHRGFDEFYGTLANTPYYHPTNFVDSRVSHDVQSVPDDDFYTTDHYADRAVEFIEQHQGKPWFLYLPFNCAARSIAGTGKIPGAFSEYQGRKAAHVRRHDGGHGRCRRQGPGNGAPGRPRGEHPDLLPVG